MVVMKARAWGRIGAFLAVLGLIAPGLFSAQVFKYPKNRPERGHLIQTVPFEKWLERNYCGPACLSMVLNYWDEARTFSQRDIAADIYDSANQATYNSELVFYPRSQGFGSYSCQGSLPLLKDAVARGIPVIVLTKAIKQIDKGHYRVVIGFDEDEDQIIFDDPYFGDRMAMTYRNFLKVWALGEGRNQARWMMAVIPGQTELPIPALRDDPLTLINLATAYYRRSDFAKSRQQWELARGALGRDPFPLTSLAMISLREGKPEAAEAEALAALGLDGESAFALDVLGLAYARQGRILPAYQTLARAVRLAPKEAFIREHYRQVRALYIEASRLETVQKKETSNEKQG